VGPPPPINSYRHCHRTGPSSRRWGRRRRRSTAYRRRRAGPSSRRWGRRRRRSTAITTALVPPAAGGAAAAVDRQLSPLPPHCALQPPVGAPPPPIDRLSPPPLGLVSKSYCLTPLKPEKQLPAGL
jgi:hypothetical protein